MTIMEAIHHIDSIKPNTYSQTDKIKWLSALDGMVKSEVIDTHEGGEGVTFNGYTEETNISTELLIPAPYENLYTHYLEMQIDYANGEYRKYNNSADMYNKEYTAFKKYYNRTHMPKGKRFKSF